MATKFRRFGLTSDVLRDEMITAIGAIGGYTVDDVRADPDLAQKLDVSITPKGWKVYCGGRDQKGQCGVYVTQDDPAESRAETIEQCLKAASDWRDEIANVMRRRALVGAGLTDRHACPAWSIMVNPVVLAVAVAAGFEPWRLAQLMRNRSGVLEFDELRATEPIADTGCYVRGTDRREGADYLKGGEGGGRWWRIRHALQLLEDPSFPIRSVSTMGGKFGRAVIELRSRLPETHVNGLAGNRLGDVIAMAGFERGSVAGDLLIEKVENPVNDQRTAITVAASYVPAEPIPDGVDTGWAALAAA